MKEVLEFVFRDVPTFLGTAVLLMIVGYAIMNIRLFTVTTIYNYGTGEDDKT